MRYMGGKFRQSKAICQTLKPYINPSTIYVEPFCGGMWSVTRVVKELHPKKVILNDINRPLMLLWEKCLENGCDWLPVDPLVIEENYPKYKAMQNENDPLTAWYGVALSFGGKWFGGIARCSKGHMEKSYEPERESTRKRSICYGWWKLKCTRGLTKTLKFRMVQWCIATHRMRAEPRLTISTVLIIVNFGGGFVSCQNVV